MDRRSIPHWVPLRVLRNHVYSFSNPWLSNFSVRLFSVNRGMNGENGVEQMGEMNALGLGHQPEQTAVPVEAPGAPFFNYLEIDLAVPIQQLIADPAGRVLCRSARSRPSRTTGR